jgi:hypothetical protein
MPFPFNPTICEMAGNCVKASGGQMDPHTYAADAQTNVEYALYDVDILLQIWNDMLEHPYIGIWVMQNKKFTFEHKIAW